MRFKFLFFLAVAVAGAFLWFHSDPSVAATTLLTANMLGASDLDKIMQATDKALAAMEAKSRATEDALAEMKVKLREAELRGLSHPLGASSPNDPAGAMASEIINHENTKLLLSGGSRNVQIPIPRATFNAAITGNGESQPLVAPDRRPGVVSLPERRLTIRQLFTNLPTNSNTIEFTKETAFTNNAAVQGVGGSPSGHYEGATKAQSNMAFELESVRVPTIAHWIPASKQILSDAGQLSNYINRRLIYGLKLAEEDQFLNGDGSGGNMDGLINQASAFDGGVTNQTALDTLAKAATQLATAEYTCTGFILNPTDWLSLMLLKDQEGRYIFGDPGQMREPFLWGIPTVLTNSLAAGTFVALDAPMTGYVADREDVNVSISNSHEDYFTRNLVAIRCEERSVLVVERPTAIITGNLSHAG